MTAATNRTIGEAVTDGVSAQFRIHSTGMGFEQYAALFVVALAVLAVVRGIEVRLTLFGAALVIGAICGDVMPIVRTFLDTFSNEKFVLPICSAMGFAYVIRHTGCDTHLVQLLVAPVRRMRSLVIPGVVLVAFVVNIPIISQTSVAVCVGPVVIPLLRAAGFSALTAAATLCLGASVGGELLNAGAPELQTVTSLTKTEARKLSQTVIPELLFPYLIVAVLVHWLLTRFLEQRTNSEAASTTEPVVKINFLKAAIPLVPLAFLFLTGPPLLYFDIEKKLLAHDEAKFDARLIAVAMLIGVAAAMLVAPGKAKNCMKQFFEGAGYGFAVIVSLIVTANCFGEAIKRAGLADAIGHFIGGNPGLLLPLAVFVPWAFAFVSGSGMASTQSLYGFFHDPAVALGQDANEIGAAVSVGSAAGRTMSPVAAVVLMCASQTQVAPFAIVKRLALPLLSGLVAIVALRMLHWI